MSLFGGSSGTNAQQAPAATGIPIQTSCYGKPITLVYGRSRIAPNLIDYGNFVAIAHNNPSGGGGKGGATGGGGKGGQTSVTYTYRVDFAMGLCEGPIAGVTAEWKSQTETTIGADGIGFQGGTYPQPAWNGFTYPGVAYCFAAQYDLGNTAQLPNFNFEVAGLLAGTAPNGIDADPSHVLTDLLTNPFYGGSFPAARIGTLVTNSEAIGIPASPAYTVQVSKFATFQWNLCVVDDTGPFACVAAAPGPRQYSVDPSTGIYTFNAAQAGATVTIRYVSLSGLDAYRNFALASGLWVSPVYDSQTAASSLIDDLAKFTYASPVWSAGVLTMVPRSTVSVSANGVTFGQASNPQTQETAQAAAIALGNSLIAAGGASAIFGLVLLEIASTARWTDEAANAMPAPGSSLAAAQSWYYEFAAPLAPLFDLDDDDFLSNSNATGSASASSNDDPVLLTRARPSDQVNDIKLEFLDRGNQYAASVAEVMDQANIDAFGRQPPSSMTGHLFCDAAAANTSVQLQMQDQYIRNTYSFTLDARFCFLDPMDIVTLTDSRLGLDRQWVRITEITENDDGTLSITAEEYPSGTGAAALYSLNTGQGFVPNYNSDPGNTNTPAIFEPPPQITDTGLEIWLGLSGGTNWGGCDVYISTDGDSYQLVGQKKGPARMGVLSAPFASGSDPDTLDTCAVDLTESGGQLLAGTKDDADNFNTLCWVDGELISYQQATLTAANKYDLGVHATSAGYLRRGVYATPIGAHAAGAQFLRLDTGVFKLAYSKDKIGKTLYLKFPAFNIYDGGLQAISDAPAFTYLVKGPPAPPNVANFKAQENGNVVVFTWDAVTADGPNIKGYDIGYAPQGSTDWAAFKLLTEASAGTEMTNAEVPRGTWTFGIRARDIADQLSPSITMQDLTVTDTQPEIYDADEAPLWSGVF